MNSSDEQRLIQYCRDGDLDAFNRLVEAHQDTVFSVVLRMTRNRATAEDVTQDTFISAFRSIRSYRGGIFRAWLLRIARNAALDHFRRMKRRDESSLDADIIRFSDTVESPNPGPEAVAANNELAGAIAGCLGCLNDDQRLAIVMIDIEGHQYEETAQSMGVSIGTVKSRLNRARARMRDCLQAHPEHLPPSMRL